MARIENIWKKWREKAAVKTNNLIKSKYKHQSKKICVLSVIYLL